MLSRMALEDVEDLREAGVDVTPAEIVTLNALAVRAERGPDAPRLFAAPRRVTVGSVTLHEPTIQSSSWLTEEASAVAGDSATYWSLELFASAHATEPGFFDRLPSSPPALRREVMGWFRRVDATRAELVAALAYVLFGPEADADEIGVPGEGALEDLHGNPAEQLLVTALGARLGLDREALGVLTASQLGRAVVTAFRSDGSELHDSSREALADYFRTLAKIQKRIPVENGGKDQNPSGK